MEIFSALLALCARNSPVAGEFPAQRPVTRSFDVSLICARINGRVNNRKPGDLRRHRAHYDVIVMALLDHKKVTTVIIGSVISQGIVYWLLIAQVGVGEHHLRSMASMESLLPKANTVFKHSVSFNKKINNTLAFPPHLNIEMAEEASHTSPSQTSYAVSVLNTFETICLVISGLYGSGWHTNMLWHESRIWYGEKDYDYAMIWKQLSYGEAMPVVLHLHGVMSYNFVFKFLNHHNEVIMNSMASQITSLTIVYSTVYSGADQRKHQSSASLAFVRGIHRWIPRTKGQ